MKSGMSTLGKWLLGLSFVILLFSFQSTTYAASVGTKLTAAESGWTRYNDTANGVHFVGNWVTPTYPNYYGGSIRSTAGVGDKVVFRFYGTKIRIISDASISSTHTTNEQISIDGNKENFHINYNTGFQYLVYEKSGLAEGVHEVVITCTEEKVTSLDAFDIDSTGYLVDWYSATNLTATAGDASATLSWDAVPEATGYVINYGTESGVYTDSVTVTNDVYDGYTLENLQNGTTYYFTVQALLGNAKIESSNEAIATPYGTVIPIPDPEPSSDRSILTITMMNGLEKEYDLSTAEVNAFIDWYDNKDLGVGLAKYAFNKTWNKGPFSKRTEYVIFDKILTFNVDEYSNKE